MTARIRIPNDFIFTYQAASRSNNPQSLPPFDQSLRQSCLGTLKPLRRRTLPRRIRHSWTASRCSSLFQVVGFTGRAPFLVALHRIVPRWRIRTQTRPPAYHRFNGVGLRTCNSCLDFLLLSGFPGQFFFLRIAFALELRRPRLPLIFPFISFRLSVAGRVKPVFHSFISLPPAKNYDSKIIFLCPFAAKEISSGSPIVENVLLLLHLLFMELQNN